MYSKRLPQQFPHHIQPRDFSRTEPEHINQLKLIITHFTIHLIYLNDILNLIIVTLLNGPKLRMMRSFSVASIKIPL